MLPEIQLSTPLLTRILLMRVAVFSVILVVYVIRGIKLCDKRFYRNLLTPGGFACYSRLRLKSPVNIQFLFSFVIFLKSSFMFLLLNLKCFIYARLQIVDRGLLACSAFIRYILACIRMPFFKMSQIKVKQKHINKILSYILILYESYEFATI